MKKEGLRILIINWRSFKDPKAGGAEIATFEHAKRWVSFNNAQITWLSPKYERKLDYENISGVDFNYISIPLGSSVLNLIISFPMFYVLTAFYYIFRYKKNTDVVIDEVHGIPFLTPIYCKKKVVLFVCEVAGSIWDKMFKFPINILGKLVEKLFYKLYITKSIKAVTISNSTKKDLAKIGFKEKGISVVRCGINMPKVLELEKNEVFTIIFLNRVVKMKGVERAIKVFAEYIKNYNSNSQLLIVGKGSNSYIQELIKLTEELNIKDIVKFTGFVNEEDKQMLLATSHVLINTSYKEGWGLVNIEANAQGTPAVGFNNSANKESISDGISGYLAEDGNILDMCKKIDNIRNNKISKVKCLAHASNFNWDKFSKEFYNIISS